MIPSRFNPMGGGGNGVYLEYLEADGVSCIDFGLVITSDNISTFYCDADIYLPSSGGSVMGCGWTRPFLWIGRYSSFSTEYYSCGASEGSLGVAATYNAWQRYVSDAPNGQFTILNDDSSIKVQKSNLVYAASASRRWLLMGASNAAGETSTSFEPVSSGVRLRSAVVRLSSREYNFKPFMTNNGDKGLQDMNTGTFYPLTNLL